MGTSDNKSIEGASDNKSIEGTSDNKSIERTSNNKSIERISDNKSIEGSGPSVAVSAIQQQREQDLKTIFVNFDELGGYPSMTVWSALNCSKISGCALSGCTARLLRDIEVDEGIMSQGNMAEQVGRSIVGMTAGNIHNEQIWRMVDLDSLTKLDLPGFQRQCLDVIAGVGCDGESCGACEHGADKDNEDGEDDGADEDGENESSEGEAERELDKPGKPKDCDIYVNAQVARF
jgi:hypothetical protein